MITTEIVIIGAGPIGLAMAVRLNDKRIPFILIEKGSHVGWNMLDWGHINLFTSWAESIDPLSHRLLKQNGVDFTTATECPSGKAFVSDYLPKVAELIPSQQLRFDSEVTLVDYNSNSKTFGIVYKLDKKSITISCKTVLDASGTWGNFNQITPGQNILINQMYSKIPDSDFIDRLPERSRIAVVGSGHSAMNSLFELAEYSQHELSWLVRNRTVKFGKSKVGGKSESLENQVANLIKKNRITLTTNFNIEAIVSHDDGLSIQSKNHKEPKIVSHLISNIGASPDYSFIKGLTLNLDKTHLTPAALMSKIDPALHSCDTVSYIFEDTLVTDAPYFAIGMKSFGKASNFLLSKGYKVLDELLDYIVNRKSSCQD